MSSLREQVVEPPQAVAGAGAGADDAATMRALVDGAVGRELGLSVRDLRVGLIVARNMMTRGAHADALRMYSALVLSRPTEVDFQVGLANCASMMGEHLVALQAASCVIALAPRDPRGYLLSGRSCAGIGDLAAARQDLEDAKRLAKGPDTRAIEREATMLLARLDMVAAG